MTSNLSIVIPAFNSSETLPELVRQLSEVLSSKDEIIIIDDGSRDSTWEIIRGLSSSQLTGIRLSRNFGQHAALLAGIRAARNPITVTLDDDLQHPPSEIQVIVGCLDHETDLVFGTPKIANHSGFRNLTSRAAKGILSSSLSIEGLHSVSAFRAFKTRLRDAFDAQVGPDISIDALLSWATTRIKSVEVRHEPRTSGASNYTIRKLLRYLSDVATGYSTVPLRLATGLGVLTLVFSLGVLAYVVGRPLMTGESVPGFPFLASTIAIFSGTQLLVLGILGQYIGRMHFRVMAKPTYTIAESTSRLAE
jgi:undecaprenyl-phosphate 4-deoxy-4-formamido-L-arabinose transferase